MFGGGFLVAQIKQVVECEPPIGDDGQAMGDSGFPQCALDDLGIGPAVFDQEDVKLSECWVHRLEPEQSHFRAQRREQL